MSLYALVIANTQQQGQEWAKGRGDLYKVVTEAHQMRGFSLDNVREVNDIAHVRDTEDMIRIVQCLRNRFKGVRYYRGKY